jgi:hypothetical protein
MNNFKGQGSEFNDLITATGLADRPQSASKTKAFMSPPANPRGRSEAFETAGKKFRDQSLDTLFSRNSGDPNGIQDEQKPERKSKGFT